METIITIYILGYFLALGMCISVDGQMEVKYSLPARIIGLAIVALGSWVIVGFIYHKDKL